MDVEGLPRHHRHADKSGWPLNKWPRWIAQCCVERCTAKHPRSDKRKHLVSPKIHDTRNELVNEDVNQEVSAKHIEVMDQNAPSSAHTINSGSSSEHGNSDEEHSPDFTSSMTLRPPNSHRAGKSLDKPRVVTTFTFAMKIPMDGIVRLVSVNNMKYSSCTAVPLRTTTSLRRPTTASCDAIARVTHQKPWYQHRRDKRQSVALLRSALHRPHLNT